MINVPSKHQSSSKGFARRKIKTKEEKIRNKIMKSSIQFRKSKLPNKVIRKFFYLHLIYVFHTIKRQHKKHSRLKKNITIRKGWMNFSSFLKTYHRNWNNKKEDFFCFAFFLKWKRLNFCGTIFFTLNLILSIISY